MDGGDWTGAAMSAVNARTFRYDGLKNLWRDVQYRVVAGRSASATFTVTVQPRPKVRSLQLTVTLPLIHRLAGQGFAERSGRRDGIARIANPCYAARLDGFVVGTIGHERGRIGGTCHRRGRR